MALAVAEDAPHAAVERLDGGVKNAAGGVEVAGTESIRVARQAGPGKGERLGPEHPFQGRRDVVRLHRLIRPVFLGRAVVRPTVRTGARIGPGGLEHQQLGKLGPGRRFRVERAGGHAGLGGDRGEEPPGFGQGQAGGWGRRASPAARGGPARQPPGEPGPRRSRCKAATPPVQAELASPSDWARRLWVWK